MTSAVGRFLVAVSLCLLSHVGSADAAAAERQKVVSTLPTLTAIAREIGGEDRFEYVTLAKSDQDPHYVSPTPSLMRKTRDAAVLLEVGMQLEIWADEVADGSGNPRIFRGGVGRVLVSAGIPAEEVPSVITRAAGHIHPEGNPHIWLDPVRAKRIGASIAGALARIAPDQRTQIEERLRAFQTHVDHALFGETLVGLVGSKKLDRLMLDGNLWPFLEETEIGGQRLVTKLEGWLARARPLRGARVVEYHKTWIYFAKTFGMDLIGTIEEKPGIPPGPRHQREITERIRSEGIKVILVDNFYDPSLPHRIARDTGAQVIMVPAQVGGEAGIRDYFALISYILDQLLAVLG